LAGVEIFMGGFALGGRHQHRQLLFPGRLQIRSRTVARIGQREGLQSGHPQILARLLDQRYQLAGVGFLTCCAADFQVGTGRISWSAQVRKPATQQTWKSALLWFVAYPSHLAVSNGENGRWNAPPCLWGEHPIAPARRRGVISILWSQTIYPKMSRQPGHKLRVTLKSQSKPPSQPARRGGRPPEEHPLSARIQARLQFSR